jgi:hypothetical protein
VHKLHTLFTITLLSLAIASGIATTWVIYRLDPSASARNIIAFYVTSCLFVLGTCALTMFFFRERYGMRELVKRHFYVSLRQGAWMALLYGSSMFLQSKGLFTWLNSAFLVIALTFLESYFIYNERKPEPNQS